MQERSAALIQLYPGIQQLIVMRVSSVKRRPEVGLAGENESNLYTAFSCRLQLLKKLPVGDKIGIGDVNSSLSVGYRRQQRGMNDADARIWRAPNCAHHLVALRLNGREVARPRQPITMLLVPRRQEEL